MKKFNIILVALSVVLVLCAAVGPVWAYFTTYVTAKGGMPVRMGMTTTVSEPDVSKWTKHVVVNNQGPESCYVRAKAFAVPEFVLTYSDQSGFWSPGGEGYYYYAQPVAKGEATSELLIKIDNIPADVRDGDSFNVAVVYESTPVLYDENGEPYADWTQSVTIENEGGQN